MNIRENIPISTLTTMRLGGNARYVIELKNPTDVPTAFSFIFTKNLPFYILGSGSNVIGRDEGFPGIILINNLKGIEIISQTDKSLILKGYGGENFDDFIAYGVNLGYSGMEALSAIPGTLGAAPIQNVGAYGQEMSQVLTNVEAYDSRTGRISTIATPQMHLGYRRSIFNHGVNAGKYFIVSVTVKLTKTHLTPPFYTSLQSYVDTNHVTDFSPKSIRKMVVAIRAAKLPDPAAAASAGSFFKNVYLNSAEAKKATAKGIPVWDGGKVPSGWLIEHAGLKGKEFFGFKVSDKAALILINEHAKTYADLEKARSAIQKAVFDKFGLNLEQEPVEISL
ncbi:MAG: UDP-N-acetylmuramate dehydrogenase [Candidatus Nomurabacteria bacterium]|jgi:UDP-N-acetylmuramate dehydrogenase|nr:UDP-N-acetylmuramate dehydrogenase [Candidatus Nomurabacteria bacterium]